jgi:hypothetical protein
VTWNIVLVALTVKSFSVELKLLKVCVEVGRVTYSIVSLLPLLFWPWAHAVQGAEIGEVFKY